MRDEADELGFFTIGRRKIPKLQIRTIRELVEESKLFEFPHGYSLKSGSAKRLSRNADQNGIDLDAAGRPVAGSQSQILNCKSQMV